MPAGDASGMRRVLCVVKRFVRLRIRAGDRERVGGAHVRRADVPTANLNSALANFAGRSMRDEGAKRRRRVALWRGIPCAFAPSIARWIGAGGSRRTRKTRELA